MARDPSERFEDASQMIAALNRVSPTGETYADADKMKQTAPERPSDISFAVHGTSTSSFGRSLGESGRARVVFLAAVGIFLFATTGMALYATKSTQANAPLTSASGLSAKKPVTTQVSRKKTEELDAPPLS
jgi:hypothetical protein